MSFDPNKLDLGAIFAGYAKLSFPAEDEVLGENESHGWFSEKMAKNCSTIVYQTADRSSTVSVTNITNNPKHGLGYDDVVYVGRIYTGVGGFVRSYKPLGDTYRIDFPSSGFLSNKENPIGDFDFGKYNFKISENITPEPDQSGDE